ncbi:MAG: NUDIX domain-containing protein [Streptosporangiales bacterium]|nr:NUDIX domain-containing protein [Streptosporangiales bacterium]
MTCGDAVHAAPAWLHQLLAAAHDTLPDQLNRHAPQDGGGRQAAVLILFGYGPAGPDVLLVQRSDGLRSHAGQPAFPGGAIDPGDDGPAAAAVREAAEETGLDPAGVDVLAHLPKLHVSVSGFVVTPVIGWWRRPSEVYAADPVETAAVARVPIAELVDPANRLRVRHPRGHIGPAFRVRDMLVWGFTGGLLDRVLELGGWARPWPRGPAEDLPEDRLRLSMRNAPPPDP